MATALLTWQVAGSYSSAIGKHGRRYSVREAADGSAWADLLMVSSRTLGWSPSVEVAKKHCRDIEKHYLDLEKKRGV